MTRIFAATALAVAMAGPAAAQVAGSYTGTSADGQSVGFTVSVDGNNNLAVTGDFVFFNAPCKGGGALDSNWYWGTDSTFKNHKASGSLEFPFGTILWTLTFSADGQSATGTVSSVVPTLTPVGAKPKKAQYCKSPTQAMTVTLQGGEARVPPATSVVGYDRAGRPVATLVGSAGR